MRTPVRLYPSMRAKAIHHQVAIGRSGLEFLKGASASVEILHGLKQHGPLLRRHRCDQPDKPLRLLNLCHHPLHGLPGGRELTDSVVREKSVIPRFS